MQRVFVLEFTNQWCVPYEIKSRSVNTKCKKITLTSIPPQVTETELLVINYDNLLRKSVHGQ